MYRKLAVPIFALATLLFAAGEAYALKKCEIKPFQTYTLLNAWAPKDCTIAYAIDTDVFYLRQAGAWVTLSTNVGAQGGTIANATDTEWAFTENSENLIFDFTTDGVTFKTSTGVADITLTAIDLIASGGVGALEFDDTDASIILKDADASALDIGSAGATDLLRFITTDASPGLEITGVATQVALRVDAGTVLIDEDVAINGGAGALTLSGSGDASIVLADADSTALVIGAAGALNILGVDTTDANPQVDITGVVGQVGLHVDAGTLQVDEEATITSDLTINGGAGALTLSGSGDSSIVLADADSTALVIGATGALNILGIDTTDANPQVDITGVVGQVGLHVDAGTLLVDESATVTGTLAASAAATVGTTLGVTGLSTLCGGWTAGKVNTITGAESVTSADCGVISLVTVGIDGNTITLPDTSTVPGCVFTFVYTGADHGALLDISPNDAVADAIHGTCYEMTGDTAVEFSGADDADVGCTKATCNTGDYIRLVADGVEGYYVIGCVGIWANN